MGGSRSAFFERAGLDPYAPQRVGSVLHVPQRVGSDSHVPQWWVRIRMFREWACLDPHVLKERV